MRVIGSTDGWPAYCGGNIAGLTTTANSAWGNNYSLSNVLVTGVLSGAALLDYLDLDDMWVVRAGDAALVVPDRSFSRELDRDYLLLCRDAISKFSCGKFEFLSTCRGTPCDCYGSLLQQERTVKESLEHNLPIAMGALRGEVYSARVCMMAHTCIRRVANEEETALRERYNNPHPAAYLHALMLAAAADKHYLTTIKEVWVNIWEDVWVFMGVPLLKNPSNSGAASWASLIAISEDGKDLPKLEFIGGLNE